MLHQRPARVKSSLAALLVGNWRRQPVADGIKTGQLNGQPAFEFNLSQDGFERRRFCRHNINASHQNRTPRAIGSHVVAVTGSVAYNTAGYEQGIAKRN